MPGLIDSHCHLEYDYAPKTAQDLVQEALAAGVTHLLTIGSELSKQARVAEMSERFSNVFHTVGVHPHEAVTLTESGLDELEVFARHPKCVAIGEIGLDYYYKHSPREVQVARLRDQMELALRLDLPIVIHARDAEADLLPELRRFAEARPKSSHPPGVIHCFTGTEGFGRACLDLGFYISFSGILTFKNAKPLQDAARTFPLERLLVETDAPYLAPVPFRGKKCEPAMVVHTAAQLAQLKEVDLEELKRITFDNTAAVFRLKLAK